MEVSNGFESCRDEGGADWLARVCALWMRRSNKVDVSNGRD